MTARLSAGKRQVTQGKIEELVVQLRLQKEIIEQFSPCTLTIHVPPKESSDTPRIELKARLPHSLGASSG